MARNKHLPLPSNPIPTDAKNWHLHTGHIRLFIVGPGEDDWFPVSDSYYTGPVGNLEERNIARRAVTLLNRHHQHTRNIERADFAAILRRATLSIHAHENSRQNPRRTPRHALHG